MVTLTSNAVSKVRDYSESNEKYRDKYLRIFIQGGGCSGFQYGFAFDEKRDGDNILEEDGISVLVDPQSMIHLNGSKVDYIEDIRGSGFVVDNPNATGGCGCGSSFSTGQSSSGGDNSQGQGCGSGGCC